MALHDWKDTPEGALLLAGAREGIAVGDVLEIGSDVGEGSTILLARIAEEKGKLLYCVDTFCGWYGWDPKEPAEIQTAKWRNDRTAEILSQFIGNMQKEKLWNAVRVLRMTSVEANALIYKGHKFGFILIDGHHKPPSVDQDFEIWPDRVAEGGVLAAHDTDMGTVAAAAQKMLERMKGCWTPFGKAKRMECWRRIPHVG